MSREQPAAVLRVKALGVGYGANTVQHDVSFDVRRGSIFALMGVSGSGKSTLMRAMVGLLRPASGTIDFNGRDYWALDEASRLEAGRRFGVLFQTGALWSSMTAAQNVALPMQMFMGLDAAAVDARVDLKLSLVGLVGSRDTLPADLSGGMSKRVGLARALALDPDILFLDEPSAGLDPVSASRFDDLILDLRDGLGVTVVMVSHELASLFAICDDGVFLDAQTRTATAHGAPAMLRDTTAIPAVKEFMQRREGSHDRPSAGAGNGRG